MRQYPAYPSYRYTGREWFPEIPTDWRDSKLRWLSTRYAGGTPDKNRAEYWEDGDIPWLNSGAVNQGTITEPSELITAEGFDNSSAKWIPIDALVMALAGQGKTKGMVAQTKIRTTCNQSMAAIVINENNPRYIYWWLCAQYKNIRGLTSDEGRDGLNLEIVGGIRCPLPSLLEQQTIVRFLDFKTSQIDALIEKKKSLLEKLTEKRTAVISHAVTKGLDPAVPMKDSGVDWLEKIPAHWEAKRTKFSVSYIGSGKTPKGGSEVYVQEGIMILRSQNVHDRGLRLDDVAYITDEADSAQATSRVLAGDVLLNITGASIGRSSIVPTPFPQANVNQHVCILRPIRELVTSEYLHLLLCSRQAKDQISSLENGTSREGLNFAQVGGLLFAFPPVEEQVVIASKLATTVGAIDKQSEKIMSVIERLVEYRSAVITNAVTGKIDVRGISIPQAN